MVQHSYNVTWMLSQHQSPVLESNIATIFTKCCLSIVLTLGPQHWGATLPQCSNNVVWTLSQCWAPVLVHWHNIHIRLPECCTNVGPQCWGGPLPLHSHNIGTMLQHSPTLWKRCGNTRILVKIHCGYNIHTTSSGHPQNVAGMFKRISTNERCHNVGANTPTMNAPTLWQWCHFGWLAERNHAQKDTSYFPLVWFA